MESEISKKGEWIFNHRKELKGPILIAVGSLDKVTDYQRVVNIVGGLEDCISLKVWEGLYHETHNEPEKADVIHFNIDWLDQRVKHFKN